MRPPQGMYNVSSSGGGSSDCIKLKSFYFIILYFILFDFILLYFIFILVLFYSFHCRKPGMDTLTTLLLLLFEHVFDFPVGLSDFEKVV